MAELRFTAQRRATIHALVKARAANQAQAADRGLWKAYVRLAETLPHLLRQHGLRLTLDYLQLRANQRRDVEVSALLADWAASSGQGQLSLATLLRDKGDAAAIALTPVDTLLLQSLALADAAEFRHCCKSVEDDPSTQGPAPGEAPAPAKWPQLPTHPALTHTACRHPSIAWRYVGQIQAAAEKTYRTDQIRQVVATARSDNHLAWYDAVYRRRQEWLARQGAHAAEMALRNHLFIALGERGVWETHTLLHPTTGMPYLPASQIKNLVRRSMASRIARMPDDAGQQSTMAQWLITLLGPDVDLSKAGGATGPQGLLVVHDAWWVPGSADSPLVGDIDNNHHTAYYRQKNQVASPADSPQPHHQLAVCGSLLFAVGIQPQRLPAGEEPKVLARCLRWLQQALADRGIGGRSFTVGAGRFRPASDADAVA